MRGEKICKTKREKCWAGESMMMMTNVGSAQSDWWKRLDDSSKRKARQLGAIKVTSAIANSNYLILQVVTSSLIAPYY